MPRVAKRFSHTLIITRPKEDAVELAEALAEKGHHCIIEPMLNIEPVLSNQKKLKSVLQHKPQTILVTSRYALSVFARVSKTRDIPILAAGTATASHAKALGFRVKATGGGTARSLVVLAKKLCTPEKGPLLYIRGADITIDIARALKQDGFTCDSVILYRALTAKAFSKKLCSAVTQGKVTGALFFSDRTANAYVKLAQKYKLTDAHEGVTAFSISHNIAHTLGKLPWKDVLTATLPTTKSLLKKVNSLRR
jgi:uroporphyrinogen-III synthase